METNGDISRMVARVARAHSAVASTLLHVMGLYPGQELLLQQLWESDHRTQADLTAALGLDASTVTRTVQCLGRSGLLTRAPSATDRRAVIVSLTPAGHALRELIEEYWESLGAAATRDMSPRQRAAALVLLNRIEGNLSRSADQPSTSRT
ncbi:winged helix-turn-helix transcriptional regulator [Kineosporia sp. J2-2]|uniref:Winged helix-turn-helix transcriptional regulator n=1 Tax=Kineosporia corallincola TaxID=2835133 RepID=A0ABS5TRK7_9ACTN|nr:MarR family winged helix-turn-helix transcriptional regulator [Kineosporia corallincola]MBT0773434.1 winged helix-turn-helix transcriptional regulator [Kineosporia corallincola]